MRAPKKVTMNIRVSEDEIDRIKQAAELAEYSGYSEFVRRTSLFEASRVISIHCNRQNVEIDDLAKVDKQR